MDSLFVWIDVLPFDLNSARIAAKIDAILHKKGKPVGLRDIFIAAVSINNQLPLITRNLRHFIIIKNEVEHSLRVLTPEEAITNF